MCELYAINSSRPVRANDHLRLFYQDSVAHPHGWGLSWREGARTVLHKEPVRALDSSFLRELLDEPIEVPRLMAHIRLASVGSLAYHNCHPFLQEDAGGRTWVIAHNGTMLDARLLEGCAARAQGDTDSEQLAIYLVDRLSEATERAGAPLSFSERFAVLEEQVEQLSAGNKLNLMIDDGAYTYVHTNTVQPTLYVRVAGETAFICTRPLDDGDGWEELPHNCLLAYRNGRLARRGAQHDHAMDDEVYLRVVAGMNPVAG